MSSEADIIELRRRLSGIGRAPGGETFPATVRGVDGDRRTCTVEAESVTYDDVLLYAVADAGRRGFCFLPAVGSIVLVSRLGGSNELYVAMFSEVDERRKVSPRAAAAAACAPPWNSSSTRYARSR